MFHFPLNRQYILSPVILTCLLTLIYFTDLNDLLRFDRNHILEGRLFLLVSGHFTHSNFFHLLLNSLGVALVWALHGEYSQWRTYVSNLLISATVISVSLMIFFPDTIVYYGLSGVLHSLLTWGAIKDITTKENTGYLLLVGIVFKVGYEWFIGPNDGLSNMINARVAVEAHFLGVIAGLALALPALFKSKTL